MCRNENGILVSKNDFTVDCLCDCFVHHLRTSRSNKFVGVVFGKTGLLVKLWSFKKADDVW